MVKYRILVVHDSDEAWARKLVGWFENYDDRMAGYLIYSPKKLKEFWKKVFNSFVPDILILNNLDGDGDFHTSIDLIKLQRGRNPKLKVVVSSELVVYTYFRDLLLEAGVDLMVNGREEPDEILQKVMGLFTEQT